MLPYISIGIFIDGGYYAKINRALKAQERSIIRVRSLFDYICSRLAMEEGIHVSDYVVLYQRILKFPLVIQ